MLTSKLATMLSRKVVFAGSSHVHDEYVVGEFRFLRIRVRGGKFTDVSGNALTVADIQAVTV
jgi:hypothetical protein